MSRWLDRGRHGTLLIALIILVALALGLAACGDDGDTTSTGATSTEGATSTSAGATNGTDEGETDTTAGGLSAQPNGGDGASPATAVAERVGPSVVDIVASDSQGRGLGIGSGVIYSEDGVIVTNNHVVVAGGDQPAPQLSVTLATGETFRATLVGRDPISDLAVLRIQHNDLPAAEFVQDLTNHKVGDYAIAIGTPLGLEGSVTLGIISAFKREINLPGNPGATDFIQTDAAISPGNSGGALLDAQGRVIGINAAGLQPQSGAQNIGFAIPSDLVIFVVEQILQQGEVRYGYMGVQSSELTEALRQQLGVEGDVRGVVIVSVEPGSPAAAGGIQQGDVVIAINGEDVASAGDLFSVLRQTPPGQTVELRVLRNGQEQTLSVTLGERPAD